MYTATYRLSEKSRTQSKVRFFFKHFSFWQPYIRDTITSTQDSPQSETMNHLGTLTPVDKEQIKLGHALPKAILDAWGNTMHDAGTVITSLDEFNQIIEDGYVEQSSPDIPPENSKPLPKASQANSFSQPTAKTNTQLDPVLSPAVADQNTNNTDLNKESVMLDLDSVRWHVGETFFLQVHDNPSLRYTVKLIGYVKNQSILVTSPKIDGRGALIRDGQTFIVRAFPGKKAYAFTASALKSVYTPHAYLHLSYPKIVRCTAIRKSSRAIVKIIASITIGDPEQTAAAVLSDISMGGTSGLIKSQVGKKNDVGVIKFKVTTAGEDAYLSLPIVIRSIVETENSKEFRYGFEFVEMPTQSKIILSSFVHQTLAEIE